MAGKRHVVVTGEGGDYRFTVHGNGVGSRGITAEIAFATIEAAPVQAWDGATLTYDRLMAGGVDVLVHTSAAALMG